MKEALLTLTIGGVSVNDSDPIVRRHSFINPSHYPLFQCKNLKGYIQPILLLSVLCTTIFYMGANSGEGGQI